MSVKGGGGVPPKSVTFFLAKILSVKGGGGTPLTDKIRKLVFEVLPKPKMLSVEKKGQISCMTLRTYLIYYIICMFLNHIIILDVRSFIMENKTF